MVIRKNNPEGISPKGISAHPAGYVAPNPRAAQTTSAGGSQETRGPERNTAFQKMMAELVDTDAVARQENQDRFVQLDLIGVNAAQILEPDLDFLYDTAPQIGDRTYATPKEVAGGIDRLSYIGAIARGQTAPKEYRMDFSGFPSGPFSGTWNKISLTPVNVDKNFVLNGSFQQAFQIVLASEGGFSNNKADRGGATIYGIASNSNPVAYARIMEQLRRGDHAGAVQTAMMTYKNEYWDKVPGIDNLSPSAKLVAFDAAVNHGVSFSKKMVNASHGDADAMLAHRAQKYAAIIHNDETQAVFGRGWANRLAKLDALTTASEQNSRGQNHSNPPQVAAISALPERAPS